LTIEAHSRGAAAPLLTDPLWSESKHSHHVSTANDAKARQSCKIKEIGEALITAGFVSLGEQARALGLPRSTAWTVVAARHKASGLSSTIIKRMLTAPQLPSALRVRIVEYVRAKVAGLYGHSETQRHRFATQLGR
jgi:hypothetical protein